MPVSPSAALVMAEEAPEGVCRPASPALGLFFSERLCAEEEEEASGVTTARVSPAPQEALSPSLVSAPCGPRLTLFTFYI